MATSPPVHARLQNRHLASEWRRIYVSGNKPELQSYHLMSMAVLRGPVQSENTARLHALEALAL